MKMHKIEIDDEVLTFLKDKAEPFVDTPNTVLRKYLLKNKEPKLKDNMNDEFPVFAHGVPKALAQILEVIYLVKKRGYPRTEATNKVATMRNTDPPTIHDKYCRQLNKKAFEVDNLLQDHKLSDFQSLLKSKFTSHSDVIDDVFKTLK